MGYFGNEFDGASPDQRRAVLGLRTEADEIALGRELVKLFAEAAAHGFRLAVTPGGTEVVAFIQSDLKDPTRVNMNAVHAKPTLSPWLQ